MLKVESEDQPFWVNLFHRQGLGALVCHLFPGGSSILPAVFIQAFYSRTNVDLVQQVKEINYPVNDTSRPLCLQDKIWAHRDTQQLPGYPAAQPEACWSELNFTDEVTTVRLQRDATTLRRGLFQGERKKTDVQLKKKGEVGKKVHKALLLTVHLPLSFWSQFEGQFTHNKGVIFSVVM